MLSTRPLLADGIKGMRAVDHIDHLTRVLESHGKNENNVVCLIGDNIAVNQSMARIMKVPLLGCTRHKFNLAVRRWIAEQEELTPIIAKLSIFVVVVASLFIVSCANVIVFFPQVAKLMKKASTMTKACELRELTSYATVQENDTRWSSTYNMITRFLKIQKELSGHHNPGNSTCNKYFTCNNFLELRTPDVALCTCIIIYDSVSFKLFIYKIYYVYNNIVRVQNLLIVYNNIVERVQSFHTCTIKWYMHKVSCYMYRFMFVMCPICYRTNMF